LFGCSDARREDHVEKGYGKAILSGDNPVLPETRFAIGSITKQFTSACILLLAEESRLSVYDKAAKYYPHLTRANDITLLDLMNHVAGYPDYYPLDFVDRRMQKPIERGGMAVCYVVFTVGGNRLGGLMYRSTDGRIQQLLVR